MGKQSMANQIDHQVAEIAVQVRESNEYGMASWGSSFSRKDKALYRTILGFLLQVFQQLTGANYFFYYGATIFQSVGIGNPFVTQIILGAVNVFCTVPGLIFIEKYGRRRPLIFGGVWQMIWLIIFGVIGSTKDPNQKSIGFVLIMAACMFIAGFASTWGPGVWVASKSHYINFYPSARLTRVQLVKCILCVSAQNRQQSQPREIGE
jgi:SP family sugar:H+ symporter-like MFS transporter